MLWENQAALGQTPFLAEAPHPMVGHLDFVTCVFFPGLYIYLLCGFTSQSCPGVTYTRIRNHASPDTCCVLTSILFPLPAVTLLAKRDTHFSRRMKKTHLPGPCMSEKKSKSFPCLNSSEKSLFWVISHLFQGLSVRQFRAKL